MSDRVADIEEFLRQHNMARGEIVQMANDASGRAYHRILLNDGQSCVLMDVPPSEARSTQKFISISRQLSEQGFCSPKLLASDLENGLILFSDLGRSTVTKVLTTTPEKELQISLVITDVLCDLLECKLIDLDQLTPAVAGEMVVISAEGYAEKPDIAQELATIMQSCFEHICDETLFPALRDFHADNLIWRSNFEGSHRIGLLDFQDAFLAPQGYDLVSFTRDVRRDVPENIQLAMTDRFKQRTSSGTAIEAQLSCLAAQRNLRILGVFRALAQDHGKSHYLVFLQRTWRYLLEDLQQEGLEELRKIVIEEFPAPN